MLSKEENPLRDYVEAVMQEDGLKLTDVADMSLQIHDEPIPYSTMQQIIQGKVPNPGLFTLVKLAEALGRPAEDILNATLGEMASESKSYFASHEATYNNLPTNEKKVFKRFYEMLRREMLRTLRRPSDRPRSEK